MSVIDKEKDGTKDRKRNQGSSRKVRDFYSLSKRKK